MLPKPQISSCPDKTFCDDSFILVMFKTIILKLVGVPGGKIGLNVKNDIFPGLTQRIFSGCPWHIPTLYFTPLKKFIPPQVSKSAKKVKKLYFLTNFKQFP